MGHLGLDLRLALRSLARSKGTVLAVCLSIALAVAGNATIFSIIEAVLLRPIPYPDAARLAFLWQSDERVPGDQQMVAVANLADWRERCRSFSAIEGFRPGKLSLSGGDHPEEIHATESTPGGPALLGVKPALGRGFLAAEGEPGKGAVVILTDPFWRRRFGGDPRVIGSVLQLDGVPTTVIGVLPKDYEFFVTGVDVWVPLALDRSAASRTRRDLLVVGRLAPGVSLDAARRELDAVARRSAVEHPEANRGWTADACALHDQIPSPQDRKLYMLLQMAMFLVLLIACSNVANVQLARAQGREPEIAVRMALGARRGRIFRELLTESFVLAAGGGLLGLVLAAWSIDLLTRLMADVLPKKLQPAFGWPVLLFSVALTILAGLLSGLAPALAVSRPDVAGLLKLGSRSATAGRRRRLLARGIVVAEIALALTMLCGTGLLVRSILDLSGMNPGFPTGNLMTFRLPLPSKRYADGERAEAFHRRLVARLEALPGVVSATATSALPRGASGEMVEITFEGRPDPPGTLPRKAALVVVPPGFFSSLGVPRLEGRDFGPQDRAGAGRVAVMSREAVRRFFDGEVPLGRRVVLAGERRETVEIVGVVGDVMQGPRLDRGGAPPIVYLDYAQQPVRTLSYLVRTEGDPLVLAEAVRATIRGLDPTLPVAELQTFEDHVARQFYSIRTLAVLMGVFGLLALFLAAVGIYGVLSYNVAQRRQEIGIRMALGADRGRLVRMVVRQGLTLTALGFLLGSPGVFLAARALLGLLPGSVPVTLSTIPVIACLLALVAAFACFEPANEAASLDPLVALRE